MKTKPTEPTYANTRQQATDPPFFQKKRVEETSYEQRKVGFSGVALSEGAVPLAPIFHKTPTIQTKLTIGQPGDKYEQEADQTADKVVQKLTAPGPPPAASISSPEESGLQRKPIFESKEEAPAVQAKCTECEQEEQTPGLQTQSDSSAALAAPYLESRLGSTKGNGSPLPDDTRSGMEGAMGADFSGVRVHTDSSAVQMNRELGAHAFTHGSDIYFGAGKYDTESSEGKELLAHELTHTIQQNGSRPPNIQKQPNTSNNPTSTDTLSTNINIIPPEWIKKPGKNDLLVLIGNHKLLALPPSEYFTILPSQAGRQPSEPIFTVPTIGKEGLSVVRVGSRTGFQIDAGGNPVVIFPSALDAIRQSLNIQSISGIVITHIHHDHVQSFLQLVRTQQILPSQIFYPEAFAVNAAAPSSTFAAAIQAMQNDPALQRIGHGPSANYQVIPTPQGGNFIHQFYNEGNVKFDFYGISNEFRRLQNARNSGSKQPMADAASLLTKATHIPSGFSILFLGDMRGSDLTLLRTAMGDNNYDQLFNGVQVVHGFQHHMGKLKSASDRQGLVEFLIRAQLKSGNLQVIAQSQERYGSGGQFLNRSLVRALNDIGVDVHLALEPRDGNVGTITSSSGGEVTQRGQGRMESSYGSYSFQTAIRRLNRLAKADETLNNYAEFVYEGHFHAANARVARVHLEKCLIEYLTASIEGVQTGASGRSQSSLSQAAQLRQSQILRQFDTYHPFEDLLMSSHNVGFLEELARIGPHLRTYLTELNNSRSTGRMSEAGLEALWEVSPETAQRLVRSSGLPKREQSRIMSQLPGQGARMGTRVGAGFMLAVEIFNMVAPIIEQQNAKAFDENVREGLNDIIWWQEKGVFPEVQGVNDRWWPQENEWTTDPTRIQALLNDNDLDYLALTNIPEAMWDNFTIWMTSHMRNYRDWYTHVTSFESIKGEGDYIDELHWSYKKGKIEGTTFGHDLSHEWVYSQRLTLIMRAAASQMVANTKKEIKNVLQHGKDPDTGARFEAVGGTTDVFDRKPRPINDQIKVFKPDLEDPKLYTLSWRRKVRGFPIDDSEFYVFPNSAAEYYDKEIDIPDEYCVVGGANYNTYMRIFLTRNPFYPNVSELLLAKKDDITNPKNA